MAPRIARPANRSLENLLQDLFYCPACSTWRTPRSNAYGRVLLTKRNNSTLVSSTAVNASKRVPEKFKELHDSLQNLQKKASAQINQSRVQLALSGLESDRPVTRVAVLGINTSTTARQVVRLLLADSLKSEESWEKQLLSDAITDTAGILIRYGESTSPSLQPSRTPITTISIPAPILQQNNLEILVSAVVSPSSIGPDSIIGPDTFLTPFAATPTSISGRETVVSFPVHKTLVLANGLDEFQSLSQMFALTDYSSVSEEGLVDSMVNLNGAANITRPNKVTVLDISQVLEGLQEVRNSSDYATKYQVSYKASGLPDFAKWLNDSAATDSNQLPVTLLQAVRSILDNAAVNIEQEITAALIKEQSSVVSSETRAQLNKAIDSFLAEAHLELQTGLARAFESQSWRKLSWYKLFWRVDDVPLIITDLAQQYWLRESSLVIFEMLGRLHQAGLIDFVSYDGKMIEFATTHGDDLPPSVRPKTPSPSTDHLEVPDQPSLKSSELTRARQEFLSTTIPDMTATAQSSLFKAIGFSVTTTALSALTYVSTLTPSLYECGAIFALGLVFALRRMQKQWETCRNKFKQEIFGVGRAALKSTEEFMRMAVREGGRRAPDPVEVQLRTEAKAAIDKAKEALDQVR